MDQIGDRKIRSGGTGSLTEQQSPSKWKSVVSSQATCDCTIIKIRSSLKMR
jgi:hypothetical protein